jgi:hypothetical protein
MEEKEIVTEELNEELKQDESAVELDDNTSQDDGGNVNNQEHESVVKDVEDEGINLNSKEENIRALRESRKQLKAERDLYLKKLQDIENKQRLPKESTDDDEYEYDPSYKEIQNLKKQYAEMAQANERMRLYTEIPDFNKVVTEESIAILQQRFPEIAATLNNSNNTYSTGKSVYNIIKKFGLYVNEDQESKKNMVEKNINKPKASATIKNTSALSNINDYSDLTDKSVRAEIIRIATERANG